MSHPPLLPEAAPWQETLGWQPTIDQQQQFQAVYAAVLEGNARMNLTRITDPQDFWEKHLWDSLVGLVPWLAPDRVSKTLDTGIADTAVKRVVDIGTGAGFPGLPGAIACPHWQVTLLDSTQKKVRFLEELATDLALKNVRAIADRAEFLGHQPSHREQYDLALVRAVGGATTCAEYALPLVAIGGLGILYRGQWSEAEAEAVAIAAKTLGGKLLAVQPWQTPQSQGVRHCVYLKKVRPTPEAYPRAAGIPAKQPL
jgi:16S rRNA (guanine527-N7)-methyltransferase